MYSNPMIPSAETHIAFYVCIHIASSSGIIFAMWFHPFRFNNVLLVKIEGPVWYPIYHRLLVVKGVSSNPSINQPTNGKRTSMFRSSSTYPSCGRCWHETSAARRRLLPRPTPSPGQDVLRRRTTKSLDFWIWLCLKVRFLANSHFSGENENKPLELGGGIIYIIDNIYIYI